MMDLDRGTNGRTPRLRSLDVESQQDFISGFRSWMALDMDAQIREHAPALLQKNGITPGSGTSVAELRRVFEPDPLIATRLRLWITNQRQMWESLVHQFNSNRDYYLGALDAAEAKGPGSLRLNPDLNIPDYARHEIHIQPGGYVGDEFAGYIYHYGTNSFYMGQNDADEFHISLAKRATRPADGVVRKVVDLGCGIGQLTMALKEEFPEADVRGIDVAGPLLRYAHMRAVDMNLAVHFEQKLAHETGYADNSVDLVTAYILFHEVPLDITHKICAEIFRILRPGGVFDVSDFPTGPMREKMLDYTHYRTWADHHFNGERWSHEFVTHDFVATLRAAGFEAELQMPKFAWMTPSYVAKKPG